MKNYLFVLFAFFHFFYKNASHAQPTIYNNNVGYYVVAHQDDWQLFMGAKAAKNIIAGNKVVFIYVTAGDLDGGLNPYGIDLTTHDPSPYVNRTVPYYEIREIGANYSLHLITENSANGWCFEQYPTITFPVINQHPIKRYEYRNTVSYFLRIIDNDLNSMGYDHTKSGKTIDNSTTYSNWCDLTLTISQILVNERINNQLGQLNIPDIDNTLNPQDHSSHKFAGLAALYAVNHHLAQNYLTSLFVGYDSQNRPANLSVNDAANEAGMSAAYNVSLINHRIWNEWRGAGTPFQKWCARSYSRTVFSSSLKLIYDCGTKASFSPEQDSIKDESSIIYPNPSSTVLTVKIAGETDENSKVEIINPQGVKVFEQKCQQDIPLQINVGSFNQGTYFINIITKNANTTRKALIMRE